MVESLDEPFDTTQIPQPRQPQPITRTAPAPERARGGPTDEAVADLRSQLSSAQQRASVAEQRASESDRIARGAADQVNRARTAIADNQVAAVESEIAALTTESASLKAAAKAALDAGNFAEATDLQEKMADARAKLYAAGQRKAWHEQHATPIHTGRVPEQPAAPRAPQTVEERRATAVTNFTPATRAWLMNHLDVLDDIEGEKGVEARLAHLRAVKEGHAPDTPQYFRFVEEQMGMNTVTKAPRQAANGNGAAREPHVAAAPVDRGGSASAMGGTGPESVSLTPGEVEMANSYHVWTYGPNIGKPIGVKEMARRKLLMQREGRYNMGGT
jgi:hypothetical protein